MAIGEMKRQVGAGGSAQSSGAGTVYEGNGRGVPERSGAGSAAVTSPLPSISLPKGGGAIRGIGEKFAANPVTGTGSMTVPIATSPGRSGFGPQLSLSYDSGAGNGVFGFGWSLSLPSITRKTDKGLPQYRDAEESDVFILSGAEDLVPVLEEENGQWQRPSFPSRIVDGTEYRIERYRPRIEGLFARIERWTNLATGEIHWRSISRDNVTTLYGQTNGSRIFDPADPDPNHPTRIFSWLICRSYDDKGNAIVYEYAAENSDGVDVTRANERNRTPETRSANRYLKRIKYGNTISRLLPEFKDTKWLFEVVFDYGENHVDPMPPDPEERETVHAHLEGTGVWPGRQDPFSTYRAGFEVRSYRLCERVLMFHHIKDELGVEDYLVRSTEFSYDRSPIASFITSVTQSGYVAWPDPDHPTDLFLKRSLPPLEFEYSKATLSDEVLDLDPDSLENLPVGVDGRGYQWIDLDGEGVSGILTEQANTWFYKRNLGEGRFGPLERVAQIPATASLGAGQQLLDLSGDGQLDLVEFSGSHPGFYERTTDEGWESFNTFPTLPRVDWNDSNLRFVDLTGDGHADVLITEDAVFRWYPSLAEDGFSEEQRTTQSFDDEKGPRLVFADGTQSIFLADCSGDGLSDLVRIRNGEVSYWPNLGYGRFGSRVAMDRAPWFDHPENFDQRHIRLADIDGSGTTDIIYLGRGQATIYRNLSGNAWGAGETVRSFPPVDDLSTVLATDLLGNGTACLVWSSPLPGDSRRPMRYIDLMAEGKPHLLKLSRNNLGAETRVEYAASTKFYLTDRADGKPWITKLPFPVHVVERVETWDWISRNRFVTRYAYHHGYFDGQEREFRGFGMVEQWDTEQFGALSTSDAFPTGDNVDAASHVPPVLTRTWFHTGIYLGGDHVSDYFAGFLNDEEKGEYYREPGLTDAEARQLLLDDTVLPDELSVDEEREACRALKGSLLRQEVYALDGTDKAQHPYTVTERNYTIGLLQPHVGNRHAVLLRQGREAISYHYERNPADPRISHTLTLEVDSFGNVLKSAAVGYGRRRADLDLAFQEDREWQTKTFCTYSESGYTNPIDESDDHRTPLPCENRTYELTGYKPTGAGGRFQRSDLVTPNPDDANASPTHIFESEISYEDPPTNGQQRRLIESTCTLYRKNDLSEFLVLGALESLALPGETYKMAFTPGLLRQVYLRPREGQPPEDLLPDPTAVLQIDVSSGHAADRGGYVDLRLDGHWWIPSGRLFYSPKSTDTSEADLANAVQHFFLPRRYRDPFHTEAFNTESVITYDAYDMLITETRDALGNVVALATKDNAGEMRIRGDYRVLQPYWVTDCNGNRTRLAFDALGMVVGTAVMGKHQEKLGDSLDAFEADLTRAQIEGFHGALDPHVPAPLLLKGATTRVIYDLDRFLRSQRANPTDATKWLPAYVATLAREAHGSDPVPAGGLIVQISFSYSDGFGREAQKKLQAEPQPLVDGGRTDHPRWVGSGWTVFNNKGKPIRQYEPFFSQLQEKAHEFEFGFKAGVSPILFYDPVERIVLTVHPNHSWDKVVFDPWRQTTWDVNDTVTLDPRADGDVKGFFSNPDGSARLSDDVYMPTWYSLRKDPTNAGVAGRRWPDKKTREAEKVAADKAALHAQTPTVAHFDALGRNFLTFAHNGFTAEGAPIQYPTRLHLDIEGNLREVGDAIQQNGDKLGRVVMRYVYDMLSARLHQASMEGGERWFLNDVTSKPIRTWDSRKHQVRTEYDQLRRPIGVYLGNDAPAEVQIGKTSYGESQLDPETRNLRGRMVESRDQVGLLTNDSYDFKGNLLRSRRQLAVEYETSLDWLMVVPLEGQVYRNSTRYDALNRPIQFIAPHTDTGSTKIHIVEHVYNESNLLEQVHAWLGRDIEPDSWLNPATADLHVVTNIDYNAKGQRTLVEHGNGAKTTYGYDPETFRLININTTRAASANGLGLQLLLDPITVQDLYYAYDPVGNITMISDDALLVIQYNNENVEPRCEFTYDALYRLIIARGREHIGQTAFDSLPADGNYRDYPFVGSRVNPSDPKAFRNYTETYDYDQVGNILSIGHSAKSGGWARKYVYQEPSLLDPNNTSNRLSGTTVGNGQPELYTHDIHGNTTHMPHLPLMRWDYRDQLEATARQVVNNGTPETTWYKYDASGLRVRKATNHDATAGQTPKRMMEHIYLSGIDVYRRYQADGVTIELERETLHIMEGNRRIALVETKTIESGNAVHTPLRLHRYQLTNQLGSVTLELAKDGALVSYEEYHPYGTTAFQAGRSIVELNLKRYRFTGKERDAETGFNYHGARYYARWLGRLTSCDPAGIADGTNCYEYVGGNPSNRMDPGGRQWGGPWEEQMRMQQLVEAIRPVSEAIDAAVEGTGKVAKGAGTAVWDFGVGSLKLATGLLGASWGEETVAETVEGVKNLPQTVKQTVKDWDKLPLEDKAYAVTTGVLMVRGAYKLGRAGVGALVKSGEVPATPTGPEGSPAIDAPTATKPGTVVQPAATGGGTPTGGSRLPSGAGQPPSAGEPLFPQLTEGEVGSAVDKATSGTPAELPGQNPRTGEGLLNQVTKADPKKPIAHHETSTFRRIKGAPGGKVEVRRHSANPKAPEGSYSRDNPTTQVNSVKPKEYMLPDGTFKPLDAMTDAEKAAAHYK